MDTKTDIVGRNIEHTTWRQKSAYIYSNLDALYDCVVTLGASYDDYNDSSGDVDAVSPKTGIRCDMSEGLHLRLVALRSVKPALVTNQTIQPTQVAGFNQFYDDFTGTKAWLFGIGLDWRPTDSLYTGVDLQYRELDRIVESASRKEFSADAEEKSGRLYIYWTPMQQWAIASGATLGSVDVDGLEVARLKTFTAPLSVNYFSPSGLFASVGPTYVWQDVQTESFHPEGASDFFVIDASIGYRLPKRSGIATLSVLNITNERFKFLDNSFRTPVDSPAISPFIPERAILGRLTLNIGR